MDILYLYLLFMDIDKIKHLSKLSQIYIGDNDLEDMKSEFEQLLWFVSKLQQIDTKNVDIMYTPIENLNMDYDRSTNTNIDKDIFINNVPHEVLNNQIVIKSSTVEH